MNVFLLATMLVGVLVLPAHGQETKQVSVHGQAITLPAPQGACFLDELKDREFLDALKQSQDSNSLVLSVFAPCKSVSRLRSGTALGSEGLGMYWTLRNVAQAFPGSPRKSFIETLERKLGTLSASDLDRQFEAARKRIEGSFDAQMGKPINLGVIGKDVNALFYGVIADVNHASKSEVVVNVTAMTVVKKLFLTLRIQDVYQSSRAFDGLKQTVSRTVHQLVALNER